MQSANNSLIVKSSLLFANMSKFMWVLEWTDLFFINFLLRICLNKWESECCLNPNFLTVIPVERISKEAGLKQVVMLKHTAA